jgi:hypothetical protein
MPKKPADIAKIIREFDSYSDAKIIPDLAAAQILGIDIATLNRNNPVPRINLSEGRKDRRVGDLRALGKPQQAAE